MSSMNRQKSRDSKDNKLTVTDEAVSAVHLQPNTSESNEPKPKSRLLVDPNGRQFSSNSFDRFGDDLCELLLSYLDFEDKYRFEIVSKQWRRLVFSKVFHFDTALIQSMLHRYNNSHGIPRYVIQNQMKTLFKKCHNVITIAIHIDKHWVSWLSLLSDNYHRLKSIKLHISRKVSSESITAFGQTLGSKVEVLVINSLSNKTSLLNWCPNLKRLDNCSDKWNDWINWTTLVGNQLVPELNQLGRVWVERDQMSSFIQLVDKYEKTLKNIEVILIDSDIVDLIFQQLYRLKNLECLDFSLNETEIDIDLTPKMIMLSQCCPKLSKINFQIEFIRFSRPSKQLISNVKCLKIIGFYDKEQDNFFSNLTELMPNLRDLELSLSYNDFTNEDLNQLSRMKHLKRLLLRSNKTTTHPLDDSGVIQLIDNCKELKELVLDFRSNITVKTIPSLKELANNRPKESIRFSTQTLGIRQKAFKSIKTEIPGNLSVIVI